MKILFTLCAFTAFTSSNLLASREPELKQQETDPLSHLPLDQAKSPATYNSSEGQAEKTFKEQRIVKIIPSYNDKEWYKKNLESALARSYVKHRIILNDGTLSAPTDILNASQTNENTSSSQ